MDQDPIGCNRGCGNRDGGDCLMTFKFDEDACSQSRVIYRYMYSLRTDTFKSISRDMFHWP